MAAARNRVRAYMKPTLASLFPNASQSTVDANPEISGTIRPPQDKNSVQVKPWRSAISLHRRYMNKTEAEFALMLEAQKRAGEILRYEFEGITLRWAGVRYTPDFIVFWRDISDSGVWTEGIRLIEIKGAFTGGKFERAVERFRHARTYWGMFAFELHKKTKQGWKRIE